MKTLFALLTLALCSSPTFAQTACGLAGVTITVTPAVAAPGQSIVATLTNNSSSTIQFPSSCLFRDVRSGASCNTVIRNNFCLSTLTDVPPGGTLIQSWDQLDNNVLQVPDGDYSLQIQYRDLSFNGYGCCIPFRIESHPGDPFCLGDATCPCGNMGGAGEGCRNSTTAGSLLVGTGDAIVGNDTLVLSASGNPANVPGLFFGGPNELTPTLFGDGLRCVGGPLVRLEIVFSDAAGNASTGSSISIREGLLGGELRHYQYWFRDVTGPCGGGFNTSNAYRVNW